MGSTPKGMIIASDPIKGTILDLKTKSPGKDQGKSQTGYHTGISPLPIGIFPEKTIT